MSFYHGLLILEIRQIISLEKSLKKLKFWGHEFLKLYFFLVKNFKLSSHIFANNLNFVSKLLKLRNPESQFCELLRPQAPPFQKVAIL